MTSRPVSPAPTRRPSPIDAIAERYVDRVAQLDPLAATLMGIDGYDAQMTDYSPVGHALRADAGRAVLAELAAQWPTDAVDEVTLAAMQERIGLELELDAAGELLCDLNNIASPVQGLRDVFDLMATDTVGAWANIAARLNLLPGAVDGYVASLRESLARGRVPAIRQVDECLAQAEELADEESSFFTSFVADDAVEAVLAGAEPADTAAAQAVRVELDRGAGSARAAYRELARFLRDELAPHAPATDAVGRERYALWSRYFLGATVDLDETYAWGLEELDRVVAEQEAVAREILGLEPSGTLVEDDGDLDDGDLVQRAVAALDADPAYLLTGTQALREWMQTTSDAAVAALDGVHFDIPEPLRTLECRIAPTHQGGIYYTPPSDDFSRPGRMWWSVPLEVTEFTTWREKTTVFHEGVPGHHLQTGQAIFARDVLNRWRRLACWVSGHGEGWALYAERLMGDLGFLDNPGDRLGMLDGQRMRAARVVLDIGVHLALPAPERWGGGTWDADKALTFLRANVTMPDALVQFELTRYLGWPGQAPSYKVGQRLWEQARDDAAAAAKARGEEFDLRAFHDRALALGSVGLDVLRTALG
ncbi:DUF885 domain-containing protein [Pengzhenrongella frigida]|uniref:DUF885 domain-containing protein n=1 Tax=Pengzhenrongella frigida TaxID=1259133 RepID=A0A4V1ZHH1_9MICO|nr:DUF885 domain-containing protein [Cellulomonas sp. HLT2-17]RYV52024.1 DUF885 domain-containing protein [Cellulomonas sp. HLT2-17]